MHYLLLLTFRPGDGPRRARRSSTPRWGAGARSTRRCARPASRSAPAACTRGRDDGPRAEGGDVVVTDGPYAETKEVVFSFYILDVEDLDAATAWAAKMPAAEYGSIEVHPMVRYEFA